MQLVLKNIWGAGAFRENKHTYIHEWIIEMKAPIVLFRTYESPERNIKKQM